MGRLYTTDTVPPSGDTDAPGWTLGTVITYDADAPPLVRGAWYMRAGLTGTVGYRVYDGILQTLLATATFASTAEGWQEVELASPLNVAGLTVVLCVVASASGHYPYATGLYPRDTTTGDGTATGSRFHNADAWPQSTSTTSYYVDGVTGTRIATPQTRPRLGALLDM